MFSGRKGQASGAGTLVVIMAILIVLYLLVLPPDTRGELLGENQSVVDTDSRSNVLLSYAPEQNPASGVQTRSLPIFTLRTAVQGNVLAERSGVSLRTSVFHKQTDTIRFSASQDAQNVLLSFSAVEAKGALEVLLNGELVYNTVVDRRQPEPITLPQALLKQENELELRVSSVGFSFWNTNRYELRNVRVTGDVVSFERASQTQRFVVQDVENIREAQLLFVPDCFDRSGRMQVTHNTHLIYSGFPTCGVPLTVDLAPGQITQGENVLVFSIESGEYIIDQGELMLYRQPQGQDGQFSLSQQQLSDLSARNADIMLSLSFAEPGAEGVVSVNGQPLVFRTNQQSFANAITSYVRQGSNSVVLDSSDTAVTSIEVYEE